MSGPKICARLVARYGSGTHSRHCQLPAKYEISQELHGRPTKIFYACEKHVSYYTERGWIAKPLVRE